MRTQEFINKVFALDIIPKDCYFEITRENLVLREPTLCFDCEPNVYLYVGTESRNDSKFYTHKLSSVPEEKIKELCELVRQYAHTPIKAR